LLLGGVGHCTPDFKKIQHLSLSTVTLRRGRERVVADFLVTAALSFFGGREETPQCLFLCKLHLPFACGLFNQFLFLFTKKKQHVEREEDISLLN
jgi:hypothetical protein